MEKTAKRSTIYFDANLHTALRLKAAHSNRSISDIVNDAVRIALAEDQEDLTDIELRKNDPVLTYEALLNGLKADGKI